MDRDQVAEWVAKRYGDRLSKPSPGKRWRLDGRVATAPDIWMQLVYPAVESGEIHIEFPQNLQDMRMVLAKVMYYRLGDSNE